MPRRTLVRDRQQWIDGAAKYCGHPSTEEIYNQGGEIIAVTCRGCGVRIAEIGDCDGKGPDPKGKIVPCGKRKVPLTAFLLTGARPRRFHNEACRQATIQAEKQARAARKTEGGIVGKIR